MKRTNGRLEYYELFKTLIGYEESLNSMGKRELANVLEDAARAYVEETREEFLYRALVVIRRVLDSETKLPDALRRDLEETVSAIEADPHGLNELKVRLEGFETELEELGFTAATKRLRKAIALSSGWPPSEFLGESLAALEHTLENSPRPLPLYLRAALEKTVRELKGERGYNESQDGNEQK